MTGQAGARRRRPRGTRGLLAAVILLAGLGAGDPARAGAGEGTLHVAARADRLTVKATGVPLGLVLSEVARQTGVRVSEDARLAPGRISVDFRDLPIEAGLQRLLVGYPYALLFDGSTGPDPGPQPRLTEIRLFSGRGRLAVWVAEAEPAPEPTPTRTRADHPDPTSLPVLLNRLQDPDPDARLRAIRALDGWGPLVPAENVVALGLRHEDPETRQAVLASALPLPREDVVDRALRDPVPSVRVEALVRLLAEMDGAEPVLREALGDPDPSVQAVARQLLAAHGVR